MHVRVLVQALWVLHVARKRIEPVELSIGRVVPAGTEVLLLGFGVEVLAAVAKAGQGAGCRQGCAGGAMQSEQLAVCGECEAGGAVNLTRLEKISRLSQQGDGREAID